MALVISVGLAVEVKESTKIELGCLEKLDFSDVNLERISKMILQHQTNLNARFVMGRCLV